MSKGIIIGLAALGGVAAVAMLGDEVPTSKDAKCVSAYSNVSANDLSQRFKIVSNDGKDVMYVTGQYEKNTAKYRYAPALENDDMGWKAKGMGFNIHIKNGKVQSCEILSDSGSGVRYPAGPA